MITTKETKDRPSEPIRRREGLSLVQVPALGAGGSYRLAAVVAAAAASPKRRHTLSAHQRGYTREHQKNRALVLADGPVCALCRRRPTTTADHVVPLSKGGTNEITNLRPACGHCNFGRGTVPAPLGPCRRTACPQPSCQGRIRCRPWRLLTSVDERSSGCAAGVMSTWLLGSSRNQVGAFLGPQCSRMTL
ncbi:HNH endonuclease [Micromonospora noduli]|uniref:HNH endonuclease n=1 Tax=Micromonospora noduli TaxID=709876 RepID=UPI001C65931C|nr:HNH endonuclease signature motif containing protein [Micromonospora noduli]